MYLVGSALAFLPLSSLAGRVGTVKVYRFSLADFGIISQCLAFSPTLHTLLVLRFLQGIAGAGIVGLIPGMTAATFREHRGWALGSGLRLRCRRYPDRATVGCFLVEWFGWRSTFYINLPFAF